MDFSALDLFWIFLALSSLTPVLKKQYLEAARRRIMRQFEIKRNSRLITMIHRQEAISLLGIPVSRYIDIEDSEQVLRAIRLTPDDMPIDIILHTPGGLVLAAEQIANALVRHKAPVTVFIPHYAMSGGTLIALAADEIVMDENAVLGPVDPQIGEYPAVSILAVADKKDINETDDRTLILADVARKAVRQVNETVKKLLMANGMPEKEAETLGDELSCGKWTHDYPITVEMAKELGMPVSEGLPETIYALMSLYPQRSQRRPSVQYIPVPYRRETEPPSPSGNNRG
ncbi:MAG: ATP-dependent Clp protease proteolytic subunit [Chloroflexota bacterium]|nr:ATP-dependent Clp protease proteolytic subunit [Anaerolineae bacterium]